MRSVLEGVLETLFRNQTSANTYTKELFEELSSPWWRRGRNGRRRIGSDRARITGASLRDTLISLNLKNPIDL
jgi:hypothetical protein